MSETSKLKSCIPNVSNFTPIYIADNTVNICYEIKLYENTCSGQILCANKKSKKYLKYIFKYIYYVNYLPAGPS
jgi:hypothetical protein